MQAIDIIILIIVAVLLLFALRATVRHSTGKGGGCCGCSGCSSSSSCAQSSQGNILSSQGEISGGSSSKLIQIKGMHCSNCKHSVESALASLDGVLYADADVEKGTAKVVLKREVPNETLKEAVETRGFEVLGVE